MSTPGEGQRERCGALYDHREHRLCGKPFGHEGDHEGPRPVRATMEEVASHLDVLRMIAVGMETRASAHRERKEWAIAPETVELWAGTIVVGVAKVTEALGLPVNDWIRERMAEQDGGAHAETN